MPSLSADALTEMMGGEFYPVLLDARSEAEFSVSHLKRAVRVETVDEAKTVIEENGFNAPAVVYCSVGYRSAKLVSELLEIGISEVFNLNGSLFQWANDGRDLHRGNELVQEAHPYDKKWGKLLTGVEHRYAVESGEL